MQSEEVIYLAFLLIPPNYCVVEENQNPAVNRVVLFMAI